MTASDEDIKNARCALDVAGRVLNIDVGDVKNIGKLADDIIALAVPLMKWLTPHPVEEPDLPRQIRTLCPEITHHSNGTGWTIKDENGVVICKSPKRYKTAKDADTALLRFMKEMGVGMMT